MALLKMLAYYCLLLVLFVGASSSSDVLSVTAGNGNANETLTLVHPATTPFEPAEANDGDLPPIVKEDVVVDEVLSCIPFLGF